MKVITVGVNHRTAPVEVRERLAFAPNSFVEDLRSLRQLPGILEISALSTCNRVELTAATRDVERAQAHLCEELAARSGIGFESLREHLIVLSEKDAVAHTFKVAASLDSLVLCEPQILGQVKDAYRLSMESDTLGPILKRLYHQAFGCAKRVRTDTGIGSQSVSVASIAVDLAKRIFGDLAGRTILVVGAGVMCETAITHLKASGATRFLITNRTLARARDLAERFGGEPFALDQIGARLHEADIVITSTGSPVPIIYPTMVQRSLKQRRFKPMFFIDIAVPRDIDPAVSDIDGVFRYDMDDLSSVVADHLKAREDEARKAMEIVEEEVGNFLHWIDSLEFTPMLAALRERFHQDALDALTADKGFAKLDEAQQEAMRGMTRRVVNKLLHKPTIALREGAKRDDGELLLDSVRTLFDLHPQLQSTAEDLQEQP